MQFTCCICCLPCFSSVDYEHINSTRGEILSLVRGFMPSASNSTLQMAKCSKGTESMIMLITAHSLSAPRSPSYAQLMMSLPCHNYNFFLNQASSQKTKNKFHKSLSDSVWHFCFNAIFYVLQLLLVFYKTFLPKLIAEHRGCLAFLWHFNSSNFLFRSY